MIKRIIHRIKGLQHVYAKKSFSQSGEDMIIRHLFDVLKIPHPTYLDIGAHHPFENSNTAHFYINGSRGVLVEPNPQFCHYLKKYRKKDICVEGGIADKKGEMDFYCFDSSTLNTFSEDACKRYIQAGFVLKEKLKIKVFDISEIMEKYFSTSPPDFISLDVEGMELNLLKAFPFEKFSPKVICLETVDYSHDGLSEKNHAILDLLKLKGFRIYADTGINTIFINENLWVNMRV
ncbi:MAG: FkbM family methyltransferase [Bacteroidia bacterium]|nr:FkbM family methyltransferase [Bacteroidia bacterium]